MELPNEFVDAHWPLTKLAVEPLRIGRFGRGVFKVTAREGVFAAKVNDAPPDVDAATKELDVFPYLAVNQYPHIPGLVRTRDDAPLVHTGTRSVVLLEHIPRRFDPDAPLPPETWAELASAIAALNAFEDYPHRGGHSFVEQVPDELRRNVHGLPIAAEFGRILGRTTELRRSTQHSLVHGEVNAANSGRRADGSVVLLDWDGAGTGPTALDYGYPLITQFIDPSDCAFDRASANAFYGAYADAGGLVDAEEAFLAGLFQAMFLMWFADRDRRWARIQWAVAHEDELCTVIERATGTRKRP